MGRGRELARVVPPQVAWVTRGLAREAPLGWPGGAGGVRGAGAVCAAAERRGGDLRRGRGGDKQSGGETRRLPPSLPRALTRSLQGCGCCNGGGSGSSSGCSLEAGVEVRRGWTEAAGRSRRTDGRRRRAAWECGRRLTGWWCWARHANGKRKHRGVEGIPGRGAENELKGDTQDTRGGAGVSALQTRSKKTAPAGAWGGGVDAEGVECEYGASAQSASQSMQVSAQLDFQVLGHLLGSERLDPIGAGRDHGERPVYKRVNLPRAFQAEDFEQSTPPQRCPTPRQRKPQLFILFLEAAQGWL